MTGGVGQYLKGGDALRSSGLRVAFAQSLLAGHFVSIFCRSFHPQYGVRRLLFFFFNYNEKKNNEKQTTNRGKYGVMTTGLAVFCANLLWDHFTVTEWWTVFLKCFTCSVN